MDLLQSGFPKEWSIAHIRRSINHAVEQFIDWFLPYGDIISDGIQFFLMHLQMFLLYLPWWAVITAVAVLTYTLSRHIALSGFAAIGLFLIGLLGFWEQSIQTLSLITTAIIIAIIIGFPIGIMMALSDMVDRILKPILDIMQTLPSMVYLIPALMIFGLGNVTGILATVIYATPPLIRMINLGVRHVNPAAIEASEAFGAKWWQKLFFVQLPLAMPNIFAGINQTIMLSLSMVVIASMVAARGLGESVLIGLQRQDIGLGLLSGLSIVMLAIILDRTAQAYGARIKKQYAIEQ